MQNPAGITLAPVASARAQNTRFENSSLRIFESFEPWRLTSCLPSKAKRAQIISNTRLFFHASPGAPLAYGLLL